MDKLALERSFDEFITNVGSTVKKEEDDDDEDVGEKQLLLFNQDDEAEYNSAMFDVLQATVSTDPFRVPVTPENHRLMPVIQNVISSVELGCRLDLNLIARKAWNTEYNPMTFKAVIMRIRKPRATANIFSSGKIVCLGTKSAEESHLAARKFGRILQKLGLPVRFLNFQIHNMMARCNTVPLAVEKLYQAYQERSSYEYELFPALFFKMESGVTANIFSSGRILLSGCKSLDELVKTADALSSILTRFRRKTFYPGKIQPQ
ncbi:TATA-box-binding protein-like [Melanotaenia boesemani]|uniref:TATA-box-binding protein-like n=1 Tax=Melanotaenia boesemani TaxID=1250792 RepID=UPI001C03C883|nr:TATA-box-binding protein-like [Melanotaenia boesemani]